MKEVQESLKTFRTSDFMSGSVRLLIHSNVTTQLDGTRLYVATSDPGNHE